MNGIVKLLEKLGENAPGYFDSVSDEGKNVLKYQQQDLINEDTNGEYLFIIIFI
jgi:hypothetical protein